MSTGIVSKTNSSSPALGQHLQKRSRAWSGARLLGLVLAIAIGLYSFLHQQSSPGTSLILTPAQLALHNGSDPSLPIYVGLDGTVYDVTAGSRFYGPGGTYNVLAGKDAARAFVTGCFEDDNPDIRGAELTFAPLNPTEAELVAARVEVRNVLDRWRQVFSGKTGKPYFEVGKVVNRAPGSVKPLCEAAQKKRPVRGQQRQVTH